MEKTIATIEEKIAELLGSRVQVTVAIDGSCASGKTTLARLLARRQESNVFHMDDFFLRPEQRTPERLAQPGGNVDYERFSQEVLLPLASGRPFSYRPFDCSRLCLKQPVAVMPKTVNIIEGSYSHHPFFGEPYDLKVVLTVSDSVRERRIRQRPEFLQERFFREWIPMEQQYFRAFRIRENCDILAMPEDNQE